MRAFGINYRRNLIYEIRKNSSFLKLAYKQESCQFGFKNFAIQTFKKAIENCQLFYEQKAEKIRLYYNILADRNSQRIPRCPMNMNDIRVNYERTKDQFKEKILENINKPYLLTTKDALPESDNSFYHNAINPGDVNEMEMRKKKMFEFVNSSKFDEFYEEIIQTMQELTQFDVFSLLTDFPTDEALRYSKLYSSLEEYGFYGSNDRKVCFWSGQKGMDEARRNEELADFQIPNSAFIQLLQIEIETVEKKQGKNLLKDVFLTSHQVMFSFNSYGNVKVYQSGYKSNEKPSLLAGNCFWIAELTTLQFLRRKKKVESIQIYIPIQEDPITWDEGRELGDFDDSSIDDFSIVRRDPYLPSEDNKAQELLHQANLSKINDEDPSLFVPREYDPKLFEAYLKSSPRKQITIGTIKRMIRIWKSKALYRL